MTTALAIIRRVPPLGWACFGLLLLLASAGLRINGLRVELAEARTALADEKRDRASVLVEAIEKARKDDADTIKTQLRALDHATDQSEALRRDLVRLGTASRSLRDELARTRAGAAAAASDPTASESCKAAAQDAVVLSDLLSSCSARRRDLAQYADQSRIAGQLCVATYEALTP